MINGNFLKHPTINKKKFNKRCVYVEWNTFESITTIFFEKQSFEYVMYTRSDYIFEKNLYAFGGIVELPSMNYNRYEILWSVGYVFEVLMSFIC